MLRFLAEDGSRSKKVDQMKLRALGMIVWASVLCRFSIAGAAQITYVFDGTASGSLGAQNFSNVDLSATAVTDTADVPANGEEINFPAMPFTIDIGGVGPTTVSTGLLGEFHNTLFDFVDFGWQSSTSLIAVVEINNPAFLTYGMTKSIGPITETGTDPFIGNWDDMATSAGDLTVTSWNDVSFTATCGRGWRPRGQRECGAASERRMVFAGRLADRGYCRRRRVVNTSPKR